MNGHLHCRAETPKYLVQKVGRRIAEKFNLKDLRRLDINAICLLSFLFGVINVVDTFHVCIIL